MWRGPWSASATYFPRDAVSYDGASYMATAMSSGASSTPSTATLQWDLMAAKGAGIQRRSITAAAADTRAPSGTQLAATAKVVAQAAISSRIVEGRSVWYGSVGLSQVGSALAQAWCHLQDVASDQPFSQDYYVDFHHASDDHPVSLTGLLPISNPSGADVTQTAAIVCAVDDGQVQVEGADLTGIAVDSATGP
jgi:hypothetical protein